MILCTFIVAGHCCLEYNKSNLSLTVCDIIVLKTYIKSNISKSGKKVYCSLDNTKGLKRFHIDFDLKPIKLCLFDSI